MTTPPPDHPTDELEAQAGPELDDTIIGLPVWQPEVPGARPYSRDELLGLLDAHRQRSVDVVASAAQAVARGADALDQAVRDARAAGATWPELARVTNMSRQAAAQRWGR